MTMIALIIIVALAIIIMAILSSIDNSLHSAIKYNRMCWHKLNRIEESIDKLHMENIETNELIHDSHYEVMKKIDNKKKDVSNSIGDVCNNGYCNDSSFISN